MWVRREEAREEQSGAKGRSKELWEIEREDKGRKQGKVRGTSRQRYIKEIRVRLKQLQATEETKLQANVMKSFD